MTTQIPQSQNKPWFAIVVSSMDTDCHCRACLSYETMQDIPEEMAVKRWEGYCDAYRFSMTRVTLMRDGKDILKVNHPFPQAQV